MRLEKARVPVQTALQATAAMSSMTTRLRIMADMSLIRKARRSSARFSSGSAVVAAKVKVLLAPERPPQRWGAPSV